jgi:outer membrane immunogenic protein
MKLLFAAIVAALMGIVVPGSVWAQSTDAISRRLDALEKKNDTLEKENDALRDRMRRLEANRQRMASVPPPTTPSVAHAESVPLAAFAKADQRTEVVSNPAFNWTGFYVGAHGGFARGQTIGPNIGVEEQGSFGGIQMGLNYQFLAHWVIGLEQDASFGNILGSSPSVGAIGTGTLKIDAFGTFRERVGYAWDRVMFYETAGFAWAHANENTVRTSPSPESLEDNRLMTGFAAGGGIEVAATSNATVKVEYLYLDFGAKNFNSGTDQPFAADQHIQTIKVGVNWLFH